MSGFAVPDINWEIFFWGCSIKYPASRDKAIFKNWPFWGYLETNPPCKKFAAAVRLPAITKDLSCFIYA